MTPQQQRQKLADLATFYRKIGREDDAADAERRLETLNGSAEVIPIGSAASKILGRVANA
jgi:hypothetical protein